MYATVSDINARISQTELLRLTDETDSGSVDTAKLNAALEAATVEIDSYLAGRYSLPLSSPQPLLVALAVDIAIWNLYSMDISGTPENRKERYQAATKTLERISTGKQTLGAQEKTATEASQTEGSVSGSDRIFTRESMSGL